MTDHSRLVGWSSTYRERLCLHSFAHFNCSLVCSIIHVSFWRERFQIIFQRTAPIIKLWLYTYNNGAAATKPNLDWNNTFSEENKRKFFSSFSFSDLSLSPMDRTISWLLCCYYNNLFLFIFLFSSRSTGEKKLFSSSFFRCRCRFPFSFSSFTLFFSLRCVKERRQSVSQSV